ncbi:hypothetical protein HWQ46_01290 [Shewanella sp. D64]|uniref:hypothetical protein n=1 Tax=unclassified Shewanella TaxID=196818 RepID=UPI0022BA6BDD|nr:MULTISPECIES: hypothetical protein [unclassified Shewanella]MEC4724184.1 hypothetical protein [Shewanella sp. D64]MEC4736204.1 hypothetical protein [Shewanella sp. E94]WBJ97861.1 hypothetical protein HWQ47_12565 [Shewanella sp. MTB7]
MKRVKMFQLLLSFLSVCGWSLAVYALLVFDKARPDRAVGYYLSKGASVRLSWDQTHTIQLEYLIWSCAVISFISLAFNYYFAHHSKMGYWFNIPLLLMCSLVAGLYIRFM